MPLTTPRSRPQPLDHVRPQRRCADEALEGCLADFDAVWNVLTPENRGRLLHAIVQRVEVDEVSP